MTELEKIEYAKSFIDKLANGINPIDNRPAPDNDIINNVRISRCFFYVSDILRQVIENGGVKPRNNIDRKPFYITSEQNYNCLSDALKSLELVQSSIANGLSEDFFTSDLYDAYRSLGYIIGEEVEEDLVNKVFSDFCMGK